MLFNQENRKKILVNNECKFKTLTCTEALEMYTPLLKKICGKYSIRESLEYDDIFQESQLAFITAFNKYDNLKISFGYYIGICIKNALNNYVTTPKMHLNCYTHMSLDYNNDSSNNENDAYNFINIEDSSCRDIENITTQLYVKELLNTLNGIERCVLEELYLYDKTQNEIAAKLGITQAQVSRIKNRSLAKAKNFITKNESSVV